MCTTQIHFITYNTHLFFKDLVDIGPLFQDEQRRQAISMYLRSLQPGMINVAALQEVWWAEYAHEIYKDALEKHSYATRYVANDQGHLLNPPGLMLLADSNCNFKKHAGWESYKSECGESPSGWDEQDWPVWKGRIDATCEFQCSAGHTHTIGLFTTHMPVGYGSYTDKVRCSFQKVAATIQEWRNDNKGGAVFLLGDLNIDYYSTNKLPDGNTEYTDAIKNILMIEAGLNDGAAALAVDPGATVVPATNTLWQHFNPSSTGSAPQRIDYFMYADSVDQGQMTTTVNSIKVNTTGSKPVSGDVLAIDYDGHTYNCSDHYPLEIVVTLTVNE